ncbi:hypothetical protein Bca101_058772 [Brassica carinata]
MFFTSLPHLSFAADMTVFLVGVLNSGTLDLESNGYGGWGRYWRHDEAIGLCWRGVSF